MNTSRVLITGASGFLGGHIAEAFSRHGFQVRTLVRPTTNRDWLQSHGIECCPATLDQPDRIRAAFDGVDTVVHAAAKVHAYGFWRDFVRVTVDGTRQMLDAAQAAGVRHFIQISTAGVYGSPRPDGRPFDESDTGAHPARWNYYSRAKIQAEQLVRAAQTRGPITTTILRPTWVYGPRDSTSFDRIVTALRAGQLRWIGDGSNRLSLVYATDAAQAALLAATNPAAAGQVFNVAADDSCFTQREFLTRICQALDLPLPSAATSYQLAHRLGFAAECLAHLTRYRVSLPLSRLSVLLLGGQRRYCSRKIQERLNWKPSVPMDQGLDQTIRWYLSRAAAGTAATPK